MSAYAKDSDLVMTMTSFFFFEFLIEASTQVAFKPPIIESGDAVAHQRLTFAPTSVVAIYLSTS